MPPTRPEREPVPAAEAMRPGLPANPPRIPDHELLRKIGGGSYGEVWLARSVLGTWRAVKIVYRSSFDHDRPFEREFEGIQKFEPISRAHPRQLNILHVGRNDAAGYFYYVMELADDLNAEGGVQSAKSSRREGREGVPGAQEQSDGVVENRNIGKSPGADPTGELLSKTRSLQHSTTPLLQDPASYVPHTLKLDLYRRTRLPVEESIEIGLALATALEHLHANGLVHRDIKPSNIIFVNGRPKLADIGLVASMDATMSFVGTSGFLPPEGPGTPQGDIYSLGKVLYEMSMGRDRQDYPALPPDLRQWPDHGQLMELNAVVVKACESDSRGRYQSAEQMRKELALLEQGQSVRRKRASARRWAVGAKVGLAAAAVALGCLALPFLKGTKHVHRPKLEAQNLYDLGRWYYNQCTPEDHAEAFTNLTRAVQIDPKFPQPYGELIMIYGWGDVPGVSNDLQRLEGAREIANKLRAIDPNLAQTHLALSFCHFVERDWRGAEKEIREAITANPDLAIARFTYCYYLGLEGRTAEAEREGKRAQELEPGVDGRRISAIGATWPFMAERRFDRAIDQLQQVLKLDWKFAMGHGYLAECYLAQSNYLAAIEEYRTCALFNHQDPARVAEIYDALRHAYLTDGEQGCLRKWIELMLADEALPVDKQMLADYSSTAIAGFYARLGEKDKALHELETRFDEPNVWSEIKKLPMYDSLHDEARYKALVKRARLEP
jgi:serine/threonine protein kinase